MEEDNQDDNSYVVSYRSPVFSKNEVKALVDLIEKHKHIILNKCTNASINHAKEAAWIRICKDINKQGFKHPRSVDSLKTKWENLKKDARKLSKNIIDVKGSEFNDVSTQIVLMINEAEKKASVTEIGHDNILEAIDEMVEESDDRPAKFLNSNDEKHLDDSDDGEDKGKLTRSLNFSPQECSLLLKCVRNEKDQIFSKGTTASAIKIKNSAWARITNTYNKQSPQKRSTKVLRTKFNNMKRLTKSVNFKNFLSKNSHEKLKEETTKVIKSEPHLDYKYDVSVENDDDDDDNEDSNHAHGITSTQNEDTSDPLSTILNRTESNHPGSCSQFQNKEVEKLKIELLKYQLETAKLERQRVQEALQAESSERQTRAIESSLRLRTARLNAVAAEMKLPSTHPALQFTAEEVHAQQYLQQFQHT